MTQLHIHSDYSVLDSCNKIEDLVAYAKERGWKALALTDHGTMGGLIEFHKECRKHKIKPILGVEMYVGVGMTNYHMVLLAKNKIGFDNLIKLNNIAVEKFYKRPRVELTDVFEHAEGLIGMSACISGYLASKFISEKIFDMKWYKNVCDKLEYFYLEAQVAGMPEQKEVLKKFKSTRLPVVLTGDVHYLTHAHKEAHDVLYAIKSKKPLGDWTLNGDYSFECKINDEMSDKIADLVEEYEIVHGAWQMPKVKMDEERLRKEFKAKCPNNEYKKRFDYEWEIITKNGFLSYFVMVADLCNYFDRNDHFRGWGRGSASGSLVSFYMGITKIDPIKWGLYFERFLNPDRISPPDIDLDFTPADRDAAIAYLSGQYGNFLKIGAYGTFGSKDVINTVSKIIGFNTKLASWIPYEAPVPTIKELMETKAFQNKVREEGAEHLIDLCLKLEGVKRSESIHASGIVKADGIPIKKQKEIISTSWDMYSLEDYRIIKFDILGVENLDIIDKISKTVIKRVENIPLDDTVTFELINSGRTMGMFQWESTGYINIIKRLHPDKFFELIDLNTLYRPGCLESGMTDEYIERKHGRKPVVQMHESLDLHMGLMLFQEDVMTVARKVAGFTMPEADILRKAIGKKDRHLLKSMKEKFIAGCRNQKISGEDLWSKIEKYGRYTWNLSHAVAYTLISYWTAYFSANYPVEYFCELLNHADAGRRTLLLNECRTRKISVEYPNMNDSDKDYKVKNGKIFIGYGGIKYIGEKTVEKIIEEQPYFNKEDFANRSGVNSRILDILDRLGLFGERKIDIDDEREFLGYYVKQRKIDTIWWGKYADIGEIIDVHKKTTKRGDPMGFLMVEMKDQMKSITVFPDRWLIYEFKCGDVGIFTVDERGVLVRYVRDTRDFMVGISAPVQVGENTVKPNVYYNGAPMGMVDLDDKTLRSLEKIGIERIK